MVLLSKISKFKHIYTKESKTPYFSPILKFIMKKIRDSTSSYSLVMIALRGLHLLMNLLFFFLYPLLLYRKKTVFSNLRKVFPGESHGALTRIQKDFYRRFLKNFEELIGQLILPEKSLRETLQVENVEIWEELKDLNKPILLATGHFGNWEKAFSSIPLYIQLPVALVYTPLKNHFFNRLLSNIRSRFGLELITRYQVKEHISNHLKETRVYLLPADQRPLAAAKSYRTSFLGISTPILFGVESFATKYHLPVVFMHIRSIKSKCQIGFTVISKESENTHYGYITERYVELLEKQIYREPTQWLWSHRRWKDLD
jgi:KDO2-lipid IV(A) lauroyltransferase